jgi:hypothetical protein
LNWEANEEEGNGRERKINRRAVGEVGGESGLNNLLPLEALKFAANLVRLCEGSLLLNWEANEGEGNGRERKINRRAMGEVGGESGLNNFLPLSFVKVRAAAKSANLLSAKEGEPG